MLDITLIRQKPDWVKDQIRKLNDAEAIARVETVLELDQRRRALLTEVEKLKSYQNKLSKATGKLKGDKKLEIGLRLATAQAVLEAITAKDFARAVELAENPTNTTAIVNADETALNEAMNTLFSQMKMFSDHIESFDEQVRVADADLRENLLWIPNLPHESVPVADSDAANIAYPPKGEIRHYDFTPQAHWNLGPALGIIDFERGVKLGGTRFYILAGIGARLQRALINFLMDELTTHWGFQEMYVPMMVKADAMYGSGQFPKFIEASYKLEEVDSYMIPTAEVAIANMFAGEILDEAQLPLAYMGHTPCFRREKMSSGRDVRGIKRVHQFEKVEMFKITTPEISYDQLEVMMQAAESLLTKLGLPHRRLEIVTGDLGFTATRKFDIEVWAPGCGEWLEVSSCSNTEDYQARRANIKYRPTAGGQARFVHMLNGSALGIPRTLIAIMENYQTKAGTIQVPDVLRPYLGGIEVIEHS
jgi:seryl-tRNA synthetase